QAGQEAGQVQEAVEGRVAGARPGAEQGIEPPRMCREATPCNSSPGLNWLGTAKVPSSEAGNAVCEIVWNVEFPAERLSKPSSMDQLIERWSKIVWSPSSPMSSIERPASPRAGRARG